MTNPYATPAGDLTTTIDDSEFDNTQFFSIKGRIGRLRYIAYTFGFSMAVYIPFAILMGFTAFSLNINPNQILFESNWLFSLYLAVLGLMIAIMLVFSVRRFNDMNLHGAWLLSLLIPVIHLIPIIALYVVPGSEGVNKYGKPPAPNTWGVIILAGLFFLTSLLIIAASIIVPILMVTLDGSMG